MSKHLTTVARKNSLLFEDENVQYISERTLVTNGNSLKVVGLCQVKLQEIGRKHKRSVWKAGHWTGRRIYSGLCTNAEDAAHLVSTVTKQTVLKWGSHAMRREKLLLDCLIRWLTSIRRAIKNINLILTASLHLYTVYINMPSLWSLNLMISFMLCVWDIIRKEKKALLVDVLTWKIYEIVLISHAVCLFLSKASEYR